jgi:hypothetical protein
MSLPDEIRNAPILLIMDGHKTRLSYEAAVLLDMFNIELLILPAHSSHLLQPVDVAVASPVKTEFKKKMDAALGRLMAADPEKREKSELLREVMVESFLVALEKGATFENIISGFRKSGIFPLERSVPLSSQFATAAPDPEIFRTINTGTEVGNKELTSTEGLEFLRNIARLPPPLYGLHAVSISPILARIFCNSVENGLAISNIPPYFEETSPDVFLKINWI